MLVSLLLVFFSVSVFSERVLLVGKPVKLYLHRDFYTFPAHYRKAHSERDYHFVTIIGKHRVCYLDSKPELASLDMIQIFIEENYKKSKWNCYQYDPRFFEIDY